MTATADRLPVVAHGAAAAVIQAALDQPHPTPALRAALAEFLRVSPRATEAAEAIPAAVWAVLREQEKVVTLLRLVGRPTTVDEIRRATGVCPQNIHAAARALARAGLVDVASGPQGRKVYTLRPGVVPRQKITRRYRVVTYLLEHGPATASEVAVHALRGPERNRGRMARTTLAMLEQRGLVAAFTDDNGATYWDLTAAARLTHYAPPDDAFHNETDHPGNPGH